MIVDDSAVQYINSVLQPNQYLKVGVVGGGCNGYSYTFDSVDTFTGDCVLIDRVVVDKRSYMFLKNSVITYKQSLGSSVLTVVNPDAKSTCGCGESFGL